MDDVEEQLLFKPAANEAHLTFDLHIPSGEHLRGGELRLYRHAVQQNSSASDSGSKQPTVYLPLHWSLRYKSETNRLGPSATISQQATASRFDKNPLLVTPTKPSDSDKYLQRINIYHLLRPISELHIIRAERNQNKTVRLNLGRVMKLLDTQVIDVRQNGWLSFDIFRAAATWTAHPEQNFGLLVTLTDVEAMPSEHSRLIVVNKGELPLSSKSSVQSSQTKPDLTDEATENDDTEDEHHDWNKLQPHVVTFSADEKYLNKNKNQFQNSETFSSRMRRENRESSRKKSSSRQNSRKRQRQRRECIRKPLYFDFNSVGWNEFVVAPQGFQTYFCSGSCVWPMTNHQNYTNHATIQAILNTHNPQSIPAPCCVPTDLSPYTLLTVDNHGNIHLRTFDDMVVEGCGCR